MVVWLRAYPSSVEVDSCCLATGLPLGCEVVFERGVRYSRLYKSSSVEVPSVGVLGGQVSGLEILHGGEGGDVELGARTSEHIFVFAFDPLTLSLSLFYLCIATFIASYHNCLCCALHHSYFKCLACLCVPHLCFNHESLI